VQRILLNEALLTAIIPLFLISLNSLVIINIILVEASLERIEQAYGKPECYVADRGFDAPSVRDLLEKLNIVNGVCPRSVPLLKEKLENEDFCLLQKRRAQTEARIGIFKNAHLGNLF